MRITTTTVGREWLAASQSYLNGDPLPLRRLAEEMQLENEDFLADSPEPNSGASAALSNYLAAYISYYSNDDSLPYDKKAGLNKRLEQLDRYFATIDLYQLIFNY